MYFISVLFFKSNGLCTTIKYLCGAAGIGLSTGARATAWAPRPSTS
jgi:hypothetical protein